MKANNKGYFHFQLPQAVAKLAQAMRQEEGRLQQKMMELYVLCYAQKHYPDLYKSYLESVANAAS